jgi:hypothetical protein
MNFLKSVAIEIWISAANPQMRNRIIASFYGPISATVSTRNFTSFDVIYSKSSKIGPKMDLKGSDDTGISMRMQF